MLPPPTPYNSQMYPCQKIHPQILRSNPTIKQDFLQTYLSGLSSCHHSQPYWPNLLLQAETNLSMGKNLKQILIAIAIYNSLSTQQLIFLFLPFSSMLHHGPTILQLTISPRLQFSYFCFCVHCLFFPLYMMPNPKRNVRN